MSKTYWLITSNSKPTPEEKEKTLILHGVNSFNVEELTRVERYNFLYVKKTDTNLLEQHCEYLKYSETLLDKMRIFKLSLSILPSGLKWAIPFLFIYLIMGTIATIILSIEYSVCIAFISTFSTAFISLMALFYEEKIFGPTASLLIGGVCGYIFFKIYIFIADMRDWNIDILSRYSIGNLLTIISLIIVFLGYTKSLISIYMDVIRITSINERN